jgi:hypothetical protein
MVWFFAAVVLYFVITHAGFRKFCLWSVGVVAGLGIMAAILNYLPHAPY